MNSNDSWSSINIHDENNDMTPRNKNKLFRYDDNQMDDFNDEMFKRDSIDNKPLTTLQIREIEEKVDNSRSDTPELEYAFTPRRELMKLNTNQ